MQKSKIEVTCTNVIQERRSVQRFQNVRGKAGLQVHQGDAAKLVEHLHLVVQRLHVYHLTGGELFQVTGRPFPVKQLGDGAAVAEIIIERPADSRLADTAFIGANHDHERFRHATSD
jgi:hypothetical protein